MYRQPEDLIQSCILLFAALVPALETVNFKEELQL